MSDELRENAARLARWAECTSYQVVSLDTVHAVAKLAESYLSDHPADDDEPVTAEWLESLGYSDSMNMRETKRYEIVDGIRVMLFACEGPRCWRADLWVGAGKCYVTPDVKRRQVRRLLAALGIEVK